MHTFKEIYNHIKENSGYIVGQRALGAFRQAKQAIKAMDLELSVSWDIDDGIDWLDALGDITERERKLWIERFNSGYAGVYIAYVKGYNNEVLASLGAIVLTYKDDSYKYTIELELLVEAYNTILNNQ